MDENLKTVELSLFMESGMALKHFLRRVERDLVKQALEHCDANRTHASALLGMNRTTLQMKLKQAKAPEAKQE